MAPCGPAPDDISRKESPSQQTTTSYGNPTLRRDRTEGSHQLLRWIERKSPNSLVMLPKGRRNREEGWCICLARHAPFTGSDRGKQIENPFELPSHPEWMCVCTTLRRPWRGRRRRTDPSQTEGTPEEQSRADGPLSHPARGRPSLYRIAVGPPLAKQEVSGSVFVAADD